MIRPTETARCEISDFLAAEVAVVDDSGTITHVNQKWNDTAKSGMLSPSRQKWNYFSECEAAIRRNCREAAEVSGGLRAVLKGELPFYVATYPCPFNGLHHWYEVLISEVRCDGKRYAVLMHVDVSALLRDKLTGVPNRTMFDAQLNMVLSSAKEKGARTGVAIVDMNKLKLLNDLHGHHVGDDALKGLATELKRVAGPDCMVARIGGDEFGVVLPASHDILSVRRMRARFDSGITSTIFDSDRLINISASFGVALYPDDGCTSRELLLVADKRMYAQKRRSAVA